MKKRVLLLFFLLFNTSLSIGFADSIIISSDVSIDSKSILKKSCYFNGKEYSKGAVVDMDEGLRSVCTNENSYELNGALSWRSVEEVNAPKKSKINVIKKSD